MIYHPLLKVGAKGISYEIEMYQLVGKEKEIMTVGVCHFEIMKIGIAELLIKNEIDKGIYSFPVDTGNDRIIWSTHEKGIERKEVVKHTDGSISELLIEFIFE